MGTAEMQKDARKVCVGILYNALSNNGMYP